MRPLIGITMSFDNSNNTAKLGEKYVSAVELAGGIPLAVPPLQDKDTLNGIVHRLDGIILSGGPDIDPSYFNQLPHPRLGNVCPRRDESEIYIAAEFIKLSKPILGICRGLQVMNVAMGGTIFQDISYNIRKPIKHMQDAPRWHKSHEIEIVDTNSLIYKIIGKIRIRVNSFHHQSVDKPAADLKITALAPDGVIEAMESKSGGFCVGIQWHPEELIDDVAHMRLFECMIDAAKDVKTRRK
ncbi:MAG: gamma-glutamyl-gamma-aminobutyrate hydrolase family protein [Thermoanaerobacteraceae bacterium]|nr:gamma-glutamyl-gamma-aminobutyrate hydrolase family protein [Thermoanaerobacteraceae bacterium]